MNKSAVEKKAKMEAALLAPLVKSGRLYNFSAAVLGILVLSGLISWAVQLQRGMVVTGMNNQVSWGLYIATFVFFVGTSLAGTLISAILRITGNHWQSTVARMAEVVTGAALVGAAAMIVVDMGRPERLLNVFFFGRLQSPLIWDVMAITTYLVGSLIYLYLPLIPDFAVLRDRLGNSVSPLRLKIYRILALGWQDTPAQRLKLDKLLHIMAVVIIPVAVSVHSVTAWIYAMTFRPGWDTTILAPYFVISAFAGGVAMVLLVASFYRNSFHLEDYITKEHFSKMGWLLLGLTLIYAYFSFAELLPGGYKLEGQELQYLTLLFTGGQAPLFWFSIIGGIVIPVVLLCWPKTRNITGYTAAAVLITVGMWIKKGFLLVVPSMQVPLIPSALGSYLPTWTETSITIAGFAGFFLLINLLFRFVPVITIWEIAEDVEGTQEPRHFVQQSDLQGGA